MNSQATKVFFVQKTGEDSYETEGIWCVKQGDYFILDNIPFVAKRVSLGDVIKAEYDSKDEAFYFDDFVAVSGNTTVRIHFHDPKMIFTARKELELLGCESEAFLTRDLIAVNIPCSLSYAPVKQYLEEGERNNYWVYDESCLAHEI